MTMKPSLVLLVCVSFWFGEAGLAEVVADRSENSRRTRRVSIQASIGVVRVVASDQETVSAFSIPFEGSLDALVGREVPENEDGESGSRAVSLVEQRNQTTINFSPQDPQRLMIVQVPSDVDLKIASTGAGVVVEGMTAEVDAECLGGDVLLWGMHGPVIASVVNHRLLVQYDSIAVGETNFLSSVDGLVEVRLPKRADVRFTLDFFNGSVDTSIPITLVPGKKVWVPETDTGFEPSRSAQSQGGATHFRITNHNGDIRIKENEDHE